MGKVTASGGIRISVRNIYVFYVDVSDLEIFTREAVQLVLLSSGFAGLESLSATSLRLLHSFI